MSGSTKKGASYGVKISMLFFSAAMFFKGNVFAAHPLITDDTGTQGKYKFQLELNSEYGMDSQDGVKSSAFEIAPILSFGVLDNVDLVFGIPYQIVKTEEVGEKSRVNGAGDSSFEIKWSFLELGELSFAFKPGISIPTGNENKGLGNGKVSYSAFFISTFDAAPLALHFNAGYMRNEYMLVSDSEANRKDLWHLSLAAQFELIKGLKLVANAGIERNSDKESNLNPAFILGGLIYSVSENFDIDIGVKRGLNDPETDITFLAGMAFRM